MARQSSHVLPNRPALLLAAASLLLATACGGGGGGSGGGSGDGGGGSGDGGGGSGTPAPISLEARLNAAGIERLTRQPDSAGDPEEFRQDPTAKVTGRLELVDELEECLAASSPSCDAADNWLFYGEYEGIGGGTDFDKHRRNVSLAIQSGAGARFGNLEPARITYVESRTALSINAAIRDSVIPQGAWVNWSRGSNFSPAYGGFNTELLRTSSVVIAISAGNFGSTKPYAQYNGTVELDTPALNAELSKAIRNTSVLFVYGMDDAATDIHPRSSHCGSRVMRACIGIAYEFLHRQILPSGIEVGVGERIFGTSFSTGLLSGTAWLMKSRWPHLTAQQIAAIMLATARPLRGGVNTITGVGVLDFAGLFEPVGPMAAMNLGLDDPALERGFLHLPGLTDFDNPEGVDKFSRSFQLATSTVAIQPGFADFDLDRFTPAAPGSRLQLAVNKQAGSIEDAAIAFGHTNKLVLSSRYIGLCRDGQSTDLCLTATRREEFFGGQGSGSFRLEDTTYTSFAATHKMPLKHRLELGLSAAVTDARTSGKHLVGDVAGRLLQAELSLRSDKDAKARKSSAAMSIWASRFDGAMELLGRQSPLAERSAGVRLRWRIDF